ncbi:hypothetical protein JMF94_03460 [Desulfovibrio sp. UIB00]|uniref:hypothetical protein n=1 Tax=Desulfovibrio sp. UIB00 TaxID=2804314 RepID=UPI001F0FEA6A|nr:hypothetical protein [Desulfovibrio sp. UIB00]MCH5144136.1 hypothetical protein [Desulfovibrio sp. UIB00]
MNSKLNILLTCEDTLMASQGKLRKELNSLIFVTQDMLPCFPRQQKTKKHLMQCNALAKQARQTLLTICCIDDFSELQRVSQDVSLWTTDLLDPCRNLTLARWQHKRHSRPKHYALRFLECALWTLHLRAMAVCSAIGDVTDAQNAYEAAKQQSEAAA